MFQSYFKHFIAEIKILSLAIEMNQRGSERVLDFTFDDNQFVKPHTQISNMDIEKMCSLSNERNNYILGCCSEKSVICVNEGLPGLLEWGPHHCEMLPHGGWARL